MSILDRNVIDDVLLRHYARPDNWYHNARHILRMLELQAEWQRLTPILKIEERRALEYAVLYHDCVMTGETPEEDSAEIAGEELVGDLDDAQIRIVKGLIMCTKPLADVEDMLDDMRSGIRWQLGTMYGRLHDADWYSFCNIAELRSNDRKLEHEAWEMLGIRSADFWRRKLDFLTSLQEWLANETMYCCHPMLEFNEQADLNVDTRLREVAYKIRNGDERP